MTKIDPNKDYYKILGVDRTASADEIKLAFFRQAKYYHPDTSFNSEKNLSKYVELVEAYEVLGNLNNRLQYSIMINSDLLNETLLHKKFKIPDYQQKKPKKKKIEKIKIEF